jgi:uncharacterized membrane protein YwaF
VKSGQHSLEFSLCNSADLESSQFGKTDAEDLSNYLGFIGCGFIAFADPDLGESFPYFELELFYTFLEISGFVDDGLEALLDPLLFAFVPLL